MLSLAIAALAAAALCWPAEAGRGRLTELHRRGVRVEVPSSRGWLTQPSLLLLPVALAAGSGVLLAGAGGGLAAAMVTGTVTARWWAGRDRRATALATTGLSDALGVLVAELRAGAHPSDAARAAADGPADATRALAAAAAAARLGGDVPAVLRSAGPVQLRSWLGRLADAWAVADRHGIPLADLLDAVRSDTEQRVRLAADIQARLAGPRATAAMLAGLPLLGLALGHAVGAAPWRVLSDTAAGQGLLVVGTGLACAGVLWSARLVSRAVPT